MEAQPLPPEHDAPPTVPGDLRERPTTWPTAVAILGIVYAVLGILGGIWSVIGWAFQGAFMGGAGGAMEDVHASQRGFMPAAIGTGILSALAAVLLLVGSIALLRRRPRARPLLLVWSVIQLAAAAAGAAVAVLMQRAMFDAMTESSGMPGPPAGLGVLIAAVTVFFTLLWGWTPAIFLLLWLNRARIKTEIATWRTH